MLNIPKQSYYIGRPALGLLRNSLCGPQTKKFGDPWHKGLKHCILYCLENDNYKTA